MRKFLDSEGFSLVELMVVMAIISILAAVAIPIFLRFVTSSKISEAEGLMKKMADGAKIYFTSEQRYSEPGGAEPWHPGGAGSSAPGHPVPWGQYVFPGASITALNTAEPECTGGTPGIAGAPRGGKKQIPCAGIAPPNGTPHSSTLNKLRFDITDPLYFKYYYEAAGSGQDATATVTAVSDFVLDGPAHTMIQMLSVDPNQEAFVGPTSTRNEFQ